MDNLLPEGFSRDSYFRFLEADYSKRMVAEHQDEQGFFGRVGPTIALESHEQKADSLEAFLSNQIEGILEDKSVLDQIDAEIKQATEANSNDKSKVKNTKSHINS